jgi:hypothetical protein
VAIDPITGQYTSPFASGAMPSLDLRNTPMANPPGTALGRAFGRGVDMLQQNLGSAVEGIGSAAGFEGLRGYGADVAARNAAQIRRSQGMEPDGGFSGYLASLFGENAPQFGVSAGLPLAGAALGPLGVAAGTGASLLLNYGFLAGENRERQKEVARAAGRPVDVNEAAAFGAAVPGAALEALSGLIGAKLATTALKGGTATKFFSGTTAANAAKAAGRGAASEVPAEVGQQFLTRAQAGQELFDAEARQEYLDAGIGAAILGGTLGAGSSIGGDYAATRQKPAQAVTDTELLGAVDKVLAPTPPLASPMLPVTPPREALGEEPLAERPLQNATDAQLLTDLAATEQRLAARAQANNGKIIATEETQSDIQNLRLLRAELALRERSAAPVQDADTAVAMAVQRDTELMQQIAALAQQREARRAQGAAQAELDQLDAERSSLSSQRFALLGSTIDLQARQTAATPFAQQDTQSIVKAIAALDKRAETTPLAPEEVQLRQVLQTELDARRTPEADARQGDLFAAQAQEAAQAKVVKAEAKKLGLSPNSKFYKGLQARNEEELVDAVLDALPTDARGVLGNIAYELGVDRDFDAEIAAMQQAVTALGSEANRTEKGAKAFKEAQAKVRDLTRRKAVYEAALVRKRLRDAGEGGQTEMLLRGGQDRQLPFERGEPASLVPASEAAPQLEGQAELPLGLPAQEQLPLFPMRQPTQQAPETGEPVTITPVQEASPQIPGQAELRLSPPPENTLVAAAQQSEGQGPMAERLRQQLTSAPKRRDAELAETQRREQQAAQAERARALVESQPAEVVRARQEGSRVVLEMSRGNPVVLTRRKDGAWDADGQYAGRTLRDARDVAVTRRNAELGVEGPRFAVRLSEPPPLLNIGSVSELTGQARVGSFRKAVERAISKWENPPAFEVYSNYDSLPQDVKDMFESPEAGRLTAAFYLPDGRIFLLADNLVNGRDAVAKFYHEALGHYGLAAEYGAERASLLQGLYDSLPSVRRMVDQWQRSIESDTLEKVYGDTTIPDQVEEALAKLSEGGPIRQMWLDRMYGLLRRYARKMGWVSKFTEADLRSIIGESHRRAMRGDFPAPAPKAVKPSATRGDLATPSEVQAAANTYADPIRSAPMLRAAAAATRGVPPTPQGDQTIVSRLMKIAGVGSKHYAGMEAQDVKEGFREKALYFQSFGHLVNQYGPMFPMLTRDGRQTNAMKELQRADALRTSIREISGRMANRPIEGFDKLSPRAQNDTLELMTATFNQLDPYKRLEDHKHLTPLQRQGLRSEHERIVQAKNRLARSGDIKVYEDMRTLMEAVYFEQMAVDLYDVVRSNEDVRRNIPSAKTNPILEFATKYKEQGDPKLTKAYWEGYLDRIAAETQQFIDSQGKTVVAQKDVGRITSLQSGLRSQLKTIAINRNAMTQYPYFHLGRFGKYFATFRLSTVRQADGKMVADPRAVEAAAEALHNFGYDNVVMKESPEGAVVFIRTESLSDADRIAQMAVQLQGQGFVAQGTTPMSGPVDPLQELSPSDKTTVDALIAEIRAANAPQAGEDAATREAREKYTERAVADIQAAYLSRLPDSATAKVMARRKGRAGFDKNMMRSFAQRMQIAGNSSASRLAAEIKGDAIKEMTSQSLQARATNADKWAMSAVLREVLKRDVARADMPPANYVDTIRAFNHNWFLSMNPGYWLTQITQLQTNLWPELVKGGVSYKRAFDAMTKTFPTAFTVVKAVIADAKEQGFLKYGADATITSETLSKITLSKDPAEDAKLKDFILRIALRGSIDIGSASRELGRVSEGRDATRGNTLMRWASSGSFYLEMMTRLTAALSARDIAAEKGMSLEASVDYAAEVVHEAMLNYTEANRARAFSRQGVAGQFTPLGTAFLTFQFQMLEKYSREIGTAFISSAATPAERTAARRWIVSHLTAMTMLAGTLGLPFVTVAARAVEAVVEAFSEGEEPYDARAALRNFYADIFGKDVAEVLARGLPRAVGFDISGRVGAADFFPFSQLIADRRNWDEALEDLAFRTYGAPFSMVADILTGGQKIMDGQFLEGMKDALPVALKNPLEAVKIGTTGITDARGNLLPIEPSTMDIIWQTLGLRPAARAEYSEANFAQSVRRSVTTREATEIRRRIISAVQSGDADRFRSALLEAQDFDRASPNFAILPGLTGAIKQAQRRLATSEAAGAPMGVSLRDIEGQQLTRFANY